MGELMLEIEIHNKRKNNTQLNEQIEECMEPEETYEDLFADIPQSIRYSLLVIDAKLTIKIEYQKLSSQFSVEMYQKQCTIQSQIKTSLKISPKPPNK